MNILSIGNSFSMDAQRWLYSIAVTEGITDLNTVNLYRGGCNLRRHCENINGNVADYMYQQNGKNTDRMITIDEALSLCKWDYITIQQVSHLSGFPQHYVPYVSMLSEHVKKACPTAILVFHQTWAYEKDSSAGCYELYNSDQHEMFRRILDASEMACILTGAKLLPCGEFIQYLRDNVPEFDYQNGGLSLCKEDGYHLSKNYGRYAAGALWFNYFTGRFSENTKEFALKYREDEYTFDPALLEVISSALKSFISGISGREDVMIPPDFALRYMGLD